MLCGCVPFEDPNTKKLYEKIKKADFVRPRYFFIDYNYFSHLSPAAIDLLEKLLAKDPEKRITIDGLRNHPFILKNGYLFQN